MKVQDCLELSTALGSFQTTRGRKCQRRSLARRLKLGRIDDLGAIDRHLIRQGRMFLRLGRDQYHDVHTRLIHQERPERNSL